MSDPDELRDARIRLDERTKMHEETEARLAKAEAALARVEALVEKWERGFAALAPHALTWPALAKGGLANLAAAADELRAALDPPEKEQQ